jgi:O-antigen/teichoic acid export membrane protein
MVRARLVLAGLVLALVAGLLVGWPVLASLVLYFALSGWTEFLGVALRARGAALSEAAVILALRAAGLVLVVAAVLAGGGLWRVSWALAASPLPAVALGAALLARTRARTPAGIAVVAGVAAVLRVSFPVAVNGVLALASLRVELFALAAWRGSREAGLFAAAMKIIEVLNMVPAAITAGAMPALAREGLRGEGPVRARTSATVALLAVPAAAGLILVAPELASRLYGAEFASASAPLRVLALSLAVLFMNNVLLHALLAAGRARWMPVLTGIRVAAAAVLALLLVPRLGEQGAAAGFLAAESLLALLASRACGAAGFAVPLAGPLVRALAASLPMVAAVALLGGGLVPSVVLGALVYAVTLALAWRLSPRVIHPESLDVHRP